MVPMNVLADVVKSLSDTEKTGSECQVLIAVLQSHPPVSNFGDEAWYVSKLKIIDDHRAGKIVVNLKRQITQVWSGQPKIWYAAQRSRKMAELPAPFPSV